MAEIGEYLKDERLKIFFLAESLKRANFRGELENELHRHGVADVHESGTAAGVLNRAWSELKAKLGGGDHTLLETAEQGEADADRLLARLRPRAARRATSEVSSSRSKLQTECPRFCSEAEWGQVRARQADRRR